ncbi:MAG TPA: hypothetical protein VLG50_06125 [Candidatus Saccharimonadales bacterium]|nr:hypothetical protein [Candidatus Saccharimonadales bacterium]
MKRQQLPKNILFLATCVTFLCWNGSSIISNGKDKRPDINFYGTIEDHKEKFNVEDILIGGRYEQISVYQTLKDYKKPTEKDASTKSEIDPKQNKSILDLHDVASIELIHADHPIASEIEINNRKYVEILVTLINGSKQNYLIESSREVSCLKIDKGPDIQENPILEARKLNMIHIRNIIIKGYKSAKDVKHTRQQDDDSQAIKKSDVAYATEKTLDQIEEKVKNLKQEDPSAFEKFKSSMLSLLRSLRQQLQTMLNMLKS